MLTGIVPVKSEAGREEIARRSRTLPGGLRSVLLLVDGQRSARELEALAARLHAPADALQQLAALGLLTSSGDVPVAETASSAPAAPAVRRYRLLYELMSDSVREQLGLRGYFLQLKIERAATEGELDALLPELQAALGKRAGAAAAAEGIARIVAAADVAAA